MKEMRIRKLWITVAVVHWLISLLTDRLFFTCESSVVYGIWTVLFLLFVLCFYQVMGYLVNEFQSGNKAVRKVIRLSGIYFLIMLVFLLLTWPGIWRVDEFSILRTAQALNINFWKGYLTYVYYIICLMMLPFPVSVILFMCAINSAIVGYLVYKLWLFTGERKCAYLLYVPFLFLPVIDSNLYPMRMSIYAFLELLLLAKICFWAYEKRFPKRNEFVWTALLAGIVTAWRSESIYYLPLFPVLLIIFFWKKLSIKQMGKALLIYLIFSLCLVGIQKVGEGGSGNGGSGDGYEITAIIRPLTPLVVEAAYAEEKDLIAAIDKVINCAYIFQGASEGEDGLAIFWTWAGAGLLKDNYTPKDFQNMKMAYYQLILRHPKTFLKERLWTYKSATGILGDLPNTDPPSTPINKTVRNMTYALLELRFSGNYRMQGKASAFVYSSFLPSLVLAAGALWFLLKKKVVYAGCVIMVALKVPLIFLTAPGGLFMYYYSPYLCGWILLFFVGILWYRKGKREAAE